MTAGTVVITGGILATVILLCIISVLCYCRLQYYCCKKNGSDSGSASPPHPACNSCGVPAGPDAPPLSLSPPPSAPPLSLSPPPSAPPSSSDPPSVSAGGRGGGGRCPTCSPGDSPFYIRCGSDGSDLFDPAVRNGGVAERGAYAPAMHYENPALALPPLPASTLLREEKRRRCSGSSSHRRGHAHRETQPPHQHFYANTRAISTDV